MAPFRLEIRYAIEEDIEFCVELENSLGVDSPRASEVGFLRANATSEAYRRFLEDEILYIAEVDAVRCGFLVALKPESKRLEQLRSKTDSFTFNQRDVLALPNIIWSAKVAVAVDQMGKGIGSRMYRKLFAEHPDANILTTTAYRPQLNKPSLEFHLSLGFRKVGLFQVGDGVTVHELLFRESRK